MSERVSATEEVLAADGHLRRVLDAMFTFVGIFSPEGVVLDLNRAPVAVGPLRREDVVGRPFLELPWWSHSADERRRVREAMARAAAGETVRLETNVVRNTGGIMYVDAAFVPLRDTSGAVAHLVGSGVDVTARHKAEAARSESERRLREAQRVAHVGSWEWDIASDRVTWSDELYRIYGLDPEQFGGTLSAFTACVHPSDLTLTRQQIERALRDVAPFTYDHRILRPDGTTRMLHTRGEAVPGPDGQAARLVGSCWDVTDRWRGVRDLQRSVSLMRATLEATADGILVVDLGGRIAAFNRRFAEMWDIPSSVIEGGDEDPLLAIAARQQENPAAFLAGVRRLYSAPDTESLDVLRLIDGRIIERHSHPQRLGAGGEEDAIVGRVWSFRDVTKSERALADLRASREQLRALAARLEAIREEERRVISREIHDQIGQALTALKLEVAGVRARLTSPAGSSDLPGRMDRIDALLDDTLETARRVSSVLRPAILDDLGLVAAIGWQAQRFQEQTGICCRVQLPADAAAGIDQARALVLFRVLQEALTNVARHAAARQVDVTLRVERDAVVLTVRDDGRGIAPADLNRPASLGLLGMRERALMFGGDVQFAGEPGRGTTVTVRLPREEAAS